MPTYSDKMARKIPELAYFFLYLMITRLYISNLPFSYSEAELSKLFIPFGRVDVVRVVRDMHTGKSRGFGFVELETKQAEEAIAALNGTTVEDRKIGVKLAKPHE